MESINSRDKTNRRRCTKLHIKTPRIWRNNGRNNIKTIKNNKLIWKNRIYNKETTVEIIGGEFDNLVEGDDVVATIPKTGEAESPDTGTWRVAIEEIILSGKM